MEAKTGDIIRFKIDHLDSENNHSFIEMEKEVLGFIIDPLGRHENKYIVIIDKDMYGIPVSEVIGIIQKEGTQLTLL